MHTRRKIHVWLDLYINRYSYLVDLIGSRQPQVFVREGGKELCHTFMEYVYVYTLMDYV